MAVLTLRPGRALLGETRVPGDKSISHRALMLGSLADGQSNISGWLPAGDTLATLNCMRSLGAEIIRQNETNVIVNGGRLSAPKGPLDFVNAGTGIRLMAGLLAGQPFESVLDGSEQLRRRPMRRITDPLRLMGANITDTNGKCPLHIRPSQIRGIEYAQEIPSAQVKSAILLAGLFADGPTTVIEPGAGRDHTERMFRAMGVPIQIDDYRITIEPCPVLKPIDLIVPGDASSAAFLIAAGILVPDSDIVLTGINTNDRRTGLLEVFNQMGAVIQSENPREEGGEPVADLVIRCGSLRGVTVGGEVVVRMIDEFPALMVAATQAEGTTLVQDAAELRVKETDRIAVMAGELRKMGAEITELPDGFSVDGPQTLRGATVDAHDDHRIGMSLAVAALIADGETTILDAGCIHDSFPGFEDVLAHLGVDLTWQN